MPTTSLNHQLNVVTNLTVDKNKCFKFVDTDEDDIIMTGKQIDFMESEGLDTTGMRRFNNESISRGVANTHVFQAPFLSKQTF